LQAKEFVADASKFIAKGEKRRVRVLSVDLRRNQIGVSLLEPNLKNSSPRRKPPPPLDPLASHGAQLEPANRGRTGTEDGVGVAEGVG